MQASRRRALDPVAGGFGTGRLGSLVGMSRACRTTGPSTVSVASRARPPRPAVGPGGGACTGHRGSRVGALRRGRNVGPCTIGAAPRALPPRPAVGPGGGGGTGHRGSRVGALRRGRHVGPCTIGAAPRALPPRPAPTPAGGACTGRPRGRRDNEPEQALEHHGWGASTTAGGRCSSRCRPPRNDRGCRTFRSACPTAQVRAVSRCRRGRGPSRWRRPGPFDIGQPVRRQDTIDAHLCEGAPFAQWQHGAAQSNGSVGRAQGGRQWGSPRCHTQDCCSTRRDRRRARAHAHVRAHTHTHVST